MAKDKKKTAKKPTAKSLPGNGMLKKAGNAIEKRNKARKKLLDSL